MAAYQKQRQGEAMAVKKEGELRVRKGDSIYGPMTREDFDRLLASGRFSLADFVSVFGGPWTEVLQFLSPPTSDHEQDALRVLRGDRIFGSLNHEHLKQLCAEGRVDDDDLVCALGGPWMAVADFLAPPRPHPSRPPETSEQSEPQLFEAEIVPLKWYHLYSEEIDVRNVDQWFVRVHGIHSAPLTKRQLRQLFSAREITADSLARHITWHPESWQPICTIADLAAVVRTEQNS